MANDSLNHPAWALHPLQQQIQHSDLRETLSETLAKASALAQIMMSTGFWEFSGRVQYDYAWALSDLIDAAHQLSLQGEENHRQG